MGSPAAVGVVAMTQTRSPQEGSVHWGMIGPLRLRLRPHVRLSRHHSRGSVWYALHDPATGRHYRFSPQAHRIMCQLDGRRTVDEILASARATEPAEALPAADMLRLLSQLYRADVLTSDAPPALGEITRRATLARRADRNQKLRSPLSIRWRLLDPSRFLGATQAIGRLAFSSVGFTVWLVVVTGSIMLGAAHWSELTGNLADRVLAAENAPLMLAAFVLAKLVHELGHGYAVTRWGGSVHEMGVLFLVFAPVPYVDASSSHTFASKWQRAAVGAAGTYAEVFLAALALLMWLALEPGLLRSAMFNLIFVAGVTTVLFNANPLLRYDGYFILCDLIESPNLGPRANRFIAYLTQRYFLGIAEASPPEVARGEAPILAGFGVASAIYRVFIILLIALFLAQQYLALGVLLAAWAVLSSILLPLLKALRFLAVSPLLTSGRGRALARCMGLAAVVLALLVALPVPLAIRTEGVVWPPPSAELAAEAAGFVAEIAIRDGEEACKGCRILRLQDPELASRIAVLEARRGALLARYQAEYTESLVKAQLTQKEIAHVEEQLALERDRSRKLDVVMPEAGTVAIGTAEDLVGRYVKRGAILGYGVKQEELVVRAIVRQDDLVLADNASLRASVRLAGASRDVLAGRIERMIPSATDRLPNLALSTSGGGAMALSPQERQDIRSLDKFFEFHVTLSGDPSRYRMGQRAHVLLVYGSEPLVHQWWRRLRQTFLRVLSV